MIPHPGFNYMLQQLNLHPTKVSPEYRDGYQTRQGAEAGNFHRGKSFIVRINLAGLKLTEKGRRKGTELLWKDLVNGDAALAVALNASVG